MLWDVSNGVSRRCWAGGSNAHIYAEYLMNQFPGLEVTIPHWANEELLGRLIKKWWWMHAFYLWTKWVKLVAITYQQMDIMVIHRSKVRVASQDLAVQLAVLLQQLLWSRSQHQHHWSWLLGFGCHTQLHSASHKHIRDVGILAHHRDVTDHVHRRHVSSQDHDTLAPLLDSLDDVLYSSPECLFTVKMAGEFQYLSPERVVGKGVGDGRVVECLVLFCLHVDNIN